jgi:hypothetical protein
MSQAQAGTLASSPALKSAAAAHVVVDCHEVVVGVVADDGVGATTEADGPDGDTTTTTVTLTLTLLLAVVGDLEPATIGMYDSADGQVRVVRAVDSTVLSFQKHACA